MDRMQFEKDKGNINSQKDYLNMKMKAAEAQEAMDGNKA
jgi:hypothetical protein